MRDLISLILEALQKHKSPTTISQEFGISRQRVYQIAQQHGIQFKKRNRISDREKKERKRRADALKYQQKKKEDLQALIRKPCVVAKRSPLSLLNERWILSQATQRSPAYGDDYYTQAKYGLRTPHSHY